MVMSRKGFTVVELVIVSGIITILTAVVFANFPKFNRELAVRRDANKLALVLRKAQSYALAVREFNSAYADDPFCDTPPVRFPPYGVSFAISDNQKYFIFGDANCDDVYTPAGNEKVEVFNLAREVKIQSLTGYSPSCLSGCSLNEANAVYQRPAPTVILSGSGGADLDRIEITLYIPGEGLSKRVIIRTTGQVSIE